MTGQTIAVITCLELRNTELGYLPRKPTDIPRERVYIGCFTHRPGRKQMFPSAQMFMEIFLVKGMFSEAVTEWRERAEGIEAQ